MKQPASLLAELRESGFFDSDWYLAKYPDVAMLGIDPVEHYLRFGAAIGRSPGPGFDGPGYLAMYPDVERAGINPLVHYARHGRQEGRYPGLARHASPTTARRRMQDLAKARLSGKPARHFPAFNRKAHASFIADVGTIHAASGSAIDGILCSVIMPAYNRQAPIVQAIESVLEQTHDNWELIIVDDGSTDATIDAVNRFLYDDRIRVFEKAHAGVSAARNLALANARGSMVFYLDSDNVWAPTYLRAMLTYLHTTGYECGYSALAVHDGKGTVTGYRGEPFSWQYCLQGNYIDLNVFCHSIGLYRELGGFDTVLRRMVDWDLILRYARSSVPAYAPFIGCSYSDNDADTGRISVSQPYAYRAIVQTKNRLDAGDHTETARQLRLNFAIKVAAPYEKRNEWGDYHYAEALATALKSLGHAVTIDFRGKWYERAPRRDHVVIVLRGLAGYRPDPEHVNVLWNISHPDQVSYEEYDAYDIVYVASLSYPELLNHIISKRARPLLQCSDTKRFAFSRSAGEPAGSDLLFVGNSRNQFRPIVRWAIEAGSRPSVYGTLWPQFIDADLIAGEYIPNEDLARHYAEAGTVLNDHWGSMRDFGFVSNRVFDVLSCGGRLISDAMPSIERLFGEAVVLVDSASSLADALAQGTSHPTSLESARETSGYIAREHAFDARAASICNDVSEHLGLPPPHARPPDTHVRGNKARRMRVGLLLETSQSGPASAGFTRLIAPLTTDLAQRHLDIVLLDDVDDDRLDQCNCCVVQRMAVDDMEDAMRLLQRVDAANIPLYVDHDATISAAVGESHPGPELCREHDTVLRHLMKGATQSWFSTAKLQLHYHDDARSSAIVRNNLDPRLWRDYRKPVREFSPGTTLQMLYMGGTTHDADFEMILPALDALAAERPGSFMLTCVGALRHPPKRDWLEMLVPPGRRGSYPHFARWLARLGPFDIGLAPLSDNSQNDCESDARLLDYAALGLISLASDAPAYRTDTGEQPFIIRVAGTDSWLAQLRRLIDNPCEYRHLPQAATDHVWSQRTVTRTAGEMLDLLGITAPEALQSNT